MTVYYTHSIPLKCFGHSCGLHQWGELQRMETSRYYKVALFHSVHSSITHRIKHSTCSQRILLVSDAWMYVVLIAVLHILNLHISSVLHFDILCTAYLRGPFTIYHRQSSILPPYIYCISLLPEKDHNKETKDFVAIFTSREVQFAVLFAGNKLI
jgi:hypothetical protein